MKKAAVTGSSGFIGTHLCKALQEKGWDVVKVDTQTGTDVLKSDALDVAFAGVDYVFHLAALPSVPYSIEHPVETTIVNLQGTLAVLEASRRAGVQRVVFSSSSAVYGDPVSLPVNEDMEVRPQSPYALQKYEGERWCALYSALYGLPTVSLRYFNVYGPGARASGAYAPAISLFLKQRAEGKPITITGDGEQTRDFVHVQDVVRANVLAAESMQVGKGEVCNVGTGVEVSINTIAQLVGGPVEHVEPRHEPRRSVADISRIQKLLQWSPTVRLEDGIAELKKLASLV